VSEPSAYNINLDTSLQQVNGSRVAKGVRRDGPWLATCILLYQFEGVAPNYLIDSESG